jgi:REP element-mobilizing transposase RayT
MDRYWLLTWTCYGQWMPGDDRGFVSGVHDDDGDRIVHNVPGTPVDSDMRGLKEHAQSLMTGPPVCLDQKNAEAVATQYEETVKVRGWELTAASVMFNHTHVVVGVTGDPDPESVLALFKSWATRALKKHRPLPPNGTFWTMKGSKRKLPDEAAICAAVIYTVRKQPNPLAIRIHPRMIAMVEAYDRASRTP